MNTTERQEFVQTLKVAATKQEDDDALFAAIIRQAGTDLSDSELADLLSVARPTVNRWKNGRTTPHRLIKPIVYQKLAERTQKMLRGTPRPTRPSAPPVEGEVAAE